MRLSGPVCALDMGASMGVVCASAGALKPQSFSVDLRGSASASMAVVFGNLIDWSNTFIGQTRPGIVVKAAPMALRAFQNIGTSESSVRATYGQHAIIEGVCQRFGIPVYRDDRGDEIEEATVRKHFIGRPSAGDRAKTKAAVIAQCVQRGFVPSLCKDDDRCDALAVWDWYCTTVMRVAPATLSFFETKAATR